MFGTVFFVVFRGFTSGIASGPDFPEPFDFEALLFVKSGKDNSVTTFLKRPLPH